MTNIHHRIRSARHKAKLTQTQVAASMQVSRPMVSFWESQRPSRIVPSVHQLQRLAAILGHSVGYFVEGTVDAAASAIAPARAARSPRIETNVATSSRPIPVDSLSSDVPYEVQTLSLEEVARILKRSVKSVKVDVTRNPRSLPTVMRVPGSRKLVVRVKDMAEWMDKLSEEERLRQAVIHSASRRKWKRRL